ncbi:23S rRNA (guanosine(2251)-2'-O)-methyltransferase RlmB [Thiothrix unzii]|jgi:23S rRNA (guanosine2251-2'-O)-methyltransferase|uniref:23S rRNA (guanosine-2'-O-)-methyltransferase RlmB n=1 Tax=Thiothrix unzii TaxID=111769 RepID=A0A975IFY0_9GAMM|nr:23S rRNA (guanosine(2251)-2'-O)-methyltransferase RlmB [Thiothrix unzii]QTR51963.1 23S rRNA (guanosine(2251)-2'-O)-methyltransferase RlmB [Thiothrix unzii]
MAKSTIYGVHAVETALRNDAENLGQIWFDKRSRNDRLKKLEKMAEDSGLRLLAMESDKLDKIAGTNKHQGIVAEYYKLKAWTENDLLDLLDGLEEPAFLLVLDGVTDPHNLGACLRTAEGAGIHAVIAPKDNAASITPTVRKVASGAAEIIPFVPVTNLARTLETLKSRGIWLTGTSDKAKQTLYQAELKGPMALVMGAEGAGIRRLTEEACDYLISIPMAGQVSSLNVSVATGVCLYEAVRQRQGAV